jgi:hypothetical protein
VLLDDREGVANERERERESATTREAGAQAADDAAGSDAEEPVLRWRRLAWPEASTADKEVGGSHFSRSGPETNERIAEGIQVQAVHEQSASGALAGP